MAKVKVSKSETIRIRENAKKDLSPRWDEVESMSAEEFNKHWHSSMAYYRLTLNAKLSKEAVVKWMTLNGYDKSQINDYKRTKDWQTNSTMGGLASSLLKGMPEIREDFNYGRNSAQWLRNTIDTVLSERTEEDVEEEVDTVQQTVSNQNKIVEVACRMAVEIEEAIEQWWVDPESIDLSTIKVISILRKQSAKPAHSKHIKGLYTAIIAELRELSSGSADPQLREAYSLKSRRKIKEILSFYEEIVASCDMIINESKATRPVKKTTLTTDKVISKLKYLKIFEPLKLVSINPASIVGAKKLWVYNTKTRKIGVYINNGEPLSVKGSTILNFDQDRSIQKSLTKPLLSIEEFKNSTKLTLENFLDKFSTVDTKLNGRINEDTILLKAIA